jgi:hypothetical protein
MARADFFWLRAGGRTLFASGSQKTTWHRIRGRNSSVNIPSLRFLEFATGRFGHDRDRQPEESDFGALPSYGQSHSRRLKLYQSK